MDIGKVTGVAEAEVPDLLSAAVAADAAYNSGDGDLDEAMLGLNLAMHAAKEGGPEVRMADAPEEDEGTRQTIVQAIEDAPNGATDVFACALNAFDDLLDSEIFEQPEIWLQGSSADTATYVKAVQIGAHIASLLRLVSEFQELVADSEGA